MRLSRRAALGLGLGGAVAAGVAGLSLLRAEPRLPAGEGPIAIAARPIPVLLPSEPERTTFGQLRYRSGLVLSSDDPEFGGWSGLWRSAEGLEIVAVSDRAEWLTARAVIRDGRTTGLTDAAVAPILDQNGQALRRGRAWDAEALAIMDGEALVAFERVHAVRRFAWAREGVRARGVSLSTPAEVHGLPFNQGLEALAVAPRHHPLAGRIVAIAERARGGDGEPTTGWLLGGRQPFAFEVARRDGFDITDLAFLPSGEALLLERRFRLLSGVACRIRRLGPDVFRPGALVEGEVVFAADHSYEIDNMEGIAVHRDPASRELVVSLISDNNFSALQRTILLEFTLA